MKDINVYLTKSSDNEIQSIYNNCIAAQDHADKIGGFVFEWPLEEVFFGKGGRK